MIAMGYTRLSDRLVVGPQVRPQDLDEIAGAGFAGIINNRPDAEAPDQPSSAELEAEAKRCGLAYWHLPVVPGQLGETEVRAFIAALEEAGGPILAFCRTGNRSTELWRAAQALS